MRDLFYFSIHMVCGVRCCLWTARRSKRLSINGQKHETRYWPQQTNVSIASSSPSLSPSSSTFVLVLVCCATCDSEKIVHSKSYSYFVFECRDRCETQCQRVDHIRPQINSNELMSNSIYFVMRSMDSVLSTERLTALSIGFDAIAASFCYQSNYWCLYLRLNDDVIVTCWIRMRYEIFIENGSRAEIQMK